jgi:hypothetical protein
VNGDDVLTTGLFAEHFDRYGVIRSGERGRTVFFQNEKAYDAPNEGALTHDGIVGYAACKAADSVDEHEAWALGSYCDHTSDDTIVQHHGFQVPVDPGIRMRHMRVIPLGGKGQYRHAVNDTGSPAPGTDTVPSKVTRFP